MNSHSAAMQMLDALSHAVGHERERAIEQFVGMIEARDCQAVIDGLRHRLTAAALGILIRNAYCPPGTLPLFESAVEDLRALESEIVKGCQEATNG